MSAPEIRGLLARVADLTEALVTRNEQLFIRSERLEARNVELEAELARLRTVSNESPNQHPAAEAAHHTLNTDAPRDRPTPATAADPDERRLLRLRAELDAYLGEIDRRLRD